MKLGDRKQQASPRAQAILCLGNCQGDTELSSQIQDRLKAWLVSPVAEIRTAAVILGTDYPSLLTPSRLDEISHDPAPTVRAAAAYSCGVSQPKAMCDRLSEMLRDKAVEVQARAALSMMAYPPELVKNILLRELNSPDFGEVFAVRMTPLDPVATLDTLLVV